MTPFVLTISSDEVAQLSDADLRTLVALLCEDEMRAKGRPVSAVTWGGEQDAADGGIDVRVKDSGDTALDFIPRSHTGFQVKVSKMGPSAIEAEMCPSGKLRESIEELMKGGGAYVIVAAKDSVTDAALKKRVAKMRAVVAKVATENAQVDFYDGNRIAAWVRAYPGRILWVKGRLGISPVGWLPYGEWVKGKTCPTEEYLLDKKLRVRDRSSSSGSELAVTEGIESVRNILREEKRSVRLTGLSGVGKTRFAEALFDDRVGDCPLDQSAALYTDLSHEPSPDPRVMANVLIAARQRVILIVDNCPPDLHRSLTEIVNSASSRVSLLTIEYDVRDDQPEETFSVTLEPNSTELISKLVMMRKPELGRPNADRIAELSDGNARVALALARVVENNESLSELRDEALFVRLFQQRNHPDKELLRIAEVMALVYSFNSNLEENCPSELALLGALINKSEGEMQAALPDLIERDLVQVRGKWRALLPHALANRLAAQALERIPRRKLEEVFNVDLNLRLVRSFSRRLSYLHRSEVARSIAQSWFAEGGLIGPLGKAGSFEWEVLKNVAPVIPAETLEQISSAGSSADGDAFLSRKNPHFREVSRLLRSLAYEEALFDRAVALLVRMVMTEDKHETSDSIRELLSSLFLMHLSGTRAGPEQRLRVIRELREEGSSAKHELAMDLLSAALTAWHFSSSYGFDFGGWPRDFGYWPKTHQEVDHWFEVYLRYVRELVERGGLEDVAAVKVLLAKRFRELWRAASDKIEDELVSLALLLHKNGGWIDGWLAARGARKLDEQELSDSGRAKLERLCSSLAPVSLVDKIEALVFSRDSRFVDFEDGEELVADMHEKLAKQAERLGEELATDMAAFGEIKQAVVRRYGYRSWSLGRGLAAGASDRTQLWNELVAELKALPEIEQKTGVLQGYLSWVAEFDRDLVDELLDIAFKDSELSQHVMALQAAAGLSDKGVARVIEALEQGTVDAAATRFLAYGRAHEGATDEAYVRLVDRVRLIEGAEKSAIELLQFRVHDAASPQSVPKSIRQCAARLLANLKVLSRKDEDFDFNLSQLVKKCLLQLEGEKPVRGFLRNLLAGVGVTRPSTAPALPETLKCIAARWPRVVLDELIGSPTSDDWPFVAAHLGKSLRGGKFISEIDEGVLVDWCNEEPEMRFERAAALVDPICRTDKTSPLSWAPQAMALVRNAPEPRKVLNAYASNFRPMCWSGSLASILASKRVVVQALLTDRDERIAEWAKEYDVVLMGWIEQERRRENDLENPNVNGFE